MKNLNLTIGCTRNKHCKLFFFPKSGLWTSISSKHIRSIVIGLNTAVFQLYFMFSQQIQNYFRYILRTMSLNWYILYEPSNQFVFKQISYCEEQLIDVSRIVRRIYTTRVVLQGLDDPFQNWPRHCILEFYTGLSTTFEFAGQLLLKTILSIHLLELFRPFNNI